MSARFLVAFLVLALGLTAARAETLAVPGNLAAFSSDQGEAFLQESRAREAYFPLISNFLTQKTQSYCGVASMVMVLNALNLPAPAVPEYDPYKTFTQDNVLNERTDAILPREKLAKMGMTLDQLGAILATQPVTVEVVHASDTTLDRFRRQAAEALGQAGRHVIVNYLRKAIQQERGGHISPLAAYDESSDRFLILDVARYKYPPVWVRSDELFAAMATTDSDNDNRSRGYVIVSAR
jgi:hypothetical protein